MITGAQRASPLARKNTMLGPHSPLRRRSVEFNNMTPMSTEFQDDLIGHTQERQASLSVRRRTSSLMRRMPSVKHKVRVLKEGKIQKLTNHQQWVHKTMTLFEESLEISDEDRHTDFIPLHEITEITFSQAGLSTLRTERRTEVEDAAGEKNAMGFLRKIRGHHGDAVKLDSQSSQVFAVCTTQDGRNSGRTYTFMAEKVEDAEEWMSTLTKQSRERIRVVRQQTRLEALRERARDIYNSWLAQAVVAFLIFANFAINAYQAEFHPDTMKSSDSEKAETYFLLDVILTVIFIAELVFNAFGHWFWPFVLDAWNWFDGLIVLLSLISILVPAIPGLNILRVLRAFRLLRLIRRLRSLNKIFHALILSIVPVLNAFFIGVIITFIYTILGVFLFSDKSYESFGTFNRSLHTLFMLVATGNWPEDEIQPFDRDGRINKVAFAYLFSFVAIVLWTCVQVVVAVLLDNFLSVTQEEKRMEAIQSELALSKRNLLDPLLQKLCDNFHTAEDLQRDIFAVFVILDVDNSGAVTNQEMLEGFAKLQVAPRIRLTLDDCKGMKQHCLGLQDNEQELDAEMFEALMRSQLHSFVQRRMHEAYIHNDDPSVAAILGGLKLALLSTGPMEQEGVAAQGVEEKVEELGRQVLAVQQQQSALGAKVDGVAAAMLQLQASMERHFAQLQPQGPAAAPPSFAAAAPEAATAPAQEDRSPSPPARATLDSVERPKLTLPASPFDSLGFLTWASPSPAASPQPPRLRDAPPPAPQAAPGPPVPSPRPRQGSAAKHIVSRATPLPATYDDEHPGADLSLAGAVGSEHAKAGGSSAANAEDAAARSQGGAARRSRERFEVVDTEWLQMCHERVGALDHRAPPRKSPPGAPTVPEAQREATRKQEGVVGVDYVVLNAGSGPQVDSAEG